MLNQEEYKLFVEHLPNDFCESLKTTFREQACYIDLKKGDTLISEISFTKNKIYFILKGSCVRTVVTPKGDERAIMFHTDTFLPIIGNMYINSDESWVSYSIIANENTQLIEFNSSIGYEWVKKDTAFTLYIYKENIQYLSTINQLQNHLIGLSSEDLYQWLLEKYPFLFKRFLSKDIASFMGVTPVWLSNIKHKILKGL